eukprot:15454389-Alexandrium_andersonii.AAC.1
MPRHAWHRRRPPGCNACGQPARSPEGPGPQGPAVEAGRPQRHNGPRLSCPQLSRAQPVPQGPRVPARWRVGNPRLQPPGT